MTRDQTIELLKTAVENNDLFQFQQLFENPATMFFIGFSDITAYEYLAINNKLYNAAKYLTEFKEKYPQYLGQCIVEGNINYLKNHLVHYIERRSIFHSIKNKDFCQQLLIKSCEYGKNDIVLFLIEYLIEKESFSLSVNNDLLITAAKHNQASTVTFLLQSPLLNEHCQNVFFPKTIDTNYVGDLSGLTQDIISVLKKSKDLGEEIKQVRQELLSLISTNVNLLIPHLTQFLNNESYMSYKDSGQTTFEYLFIESCDKRNIAALEILATNPLCKDYLTQDMVQTGLLRCNTLNGLQHERFEEIAHFLLFSPLLKYNANPSLNKYSDLLLSCELGDLPKVKILLSRPDLYRINVNSCGALSKACTHGQLDIVKYLIETPYLNADPHANGLFLFTFAINNKHTDVVKYLALCPPTDQKKSYLNYGPLLFQSANRNMHDLIDFFLYDERIKHYTSIHYQEDMVFNSVIDSGNTELIQYFIIDCNISLTKHIEHHFNTPGVIVPDSEKKINAIKYAKNLFSLRDLNRNLNDNLPDKKEIKNYKVKI